ncbi:hypothetical protein POSPLADRAFT_1144250 [Postia placenta MAD-698-R-SB12]|uniref:Uncharacterized protein n=1 Tax=Postia placenta MAD-698-R-SB12 TaxID=670580 RepID=A0A1X6MYF8_9APHY|nr:hypothetical protein POSPLADRAFT_1144250 [Postia placenta MAD-698-R-SB12]OSX61395.1 hypothetical protein POSPLADRAFT_1144250 [Postia placenta MAD-698-R-SB12]
MVRGGDKALKCGGGNAVKRNNEVNRTGGQGAPGCCLIYMRENPPGTGNGPLVPSWNDVMIQTESGFYLEKVRHQSPA